jgi:peptidoglycan/xylan/chitin deacetylase (PgdA/CDA1 family)
VTGGGIPGSTQPPRVTSTFARRLLDRVSPTARQTLIGLLALPVSVLPFVAYAQFTPAGSLLLAKLHVVVAPPTLPEYSPTEVEAMRARAPQWSGLAAVLVYHGMGSTSAEQAWTITPEHFADQIATLRASGMNAVTAADLAAARAGRAELPDNAVLVSFDDGRTDAFLWADPVLEQADWEATMFVITSEAARTSLYYASWEDIVGFAGTGRWDIESHTAGMHYEQEASGGALLPALTSLQPDETISGYAYRTTHDLDASVKSITDQVGVAPQAIAYPFGAYGAERVNDPRLQDVLADEVRSRFSLGFHQDDQETVPLAGCSGDPLLIRRLEVGDWSGTQLIDRLTEMAAEPGSANASPCSAAR